MNNDGIEQLWLLMGEEIAGHFNEKFWETTINCPTYIAARIMHDRLETYCGNNLRNLLNFWVRSSWDGYEEHLLHERLT